MFDLLTHIVDILKLYTDKVKEASVHSCVPYGYIGRAYTHSRAQTNLNFSPKRVTSRTFILLAQ
jgi:hypothetical protein